MARGTPAGGGANGFLDNEAEAGGLVSAVYISHHLL
jgi:hypothetical protein